MKVEELIEQGLIWSGARSGEEQKGSSLLPGFSPGRVHEWGCANPPLLIFCALLKSGSGLEGGRGPIFWVGEKSFPSFSLLRDLPDSFLLNTTSKTEKLYAMQKALSTKGVLAVIGESRGFSLNATRQLKLAARKGGGICLLFRPEQELLSAPSCANSKWLVKSIPAEKKLCWELSLLRAQGSSYPRYWRVQAPLDCPELEFTELQTAHNERERLYA
jgi:hypothetical protein